MKKLFLILTMCIFQFAGHAQQSTANQTITLMPYEATGFLVLNHLENPQVATWEILIQSRTQNQSGNYTYQTVETFMLNNANHIRIPQHYHAKASEFYITVRGYSSSNTILTEEGPRMANGPGWTARCGYTCVGPTYAYDLVLAVNPSNTSSHITMRPTYDYIDEDAGLLVPYYEYMSDSQFLSDPGDTWLRTTYYNVPYWNPEGYGVNNQIIRLEDPVGLTNSAGGSLSGVVYGVKKYLGYWGQTWEPAIIRSPDFAGGESHCTQTFGFFLDRINDDPDLTLPVVCEGSSGPVGGGDGPGEGGGLANEAQELVDCAWLLANSDITDPEEMIAFMKDCLGEGGGIVLPTVTRAITFQPFLPSPNGGGVTVTNDDFIDQNGNPTFPDITIEPGLNIIAFQLNDNTYLPFYYEAQGNSQGNNNQHLVSGNSINSTQGDSFKASSELVIVPNPLSDVATLKFKDMEGMYQVDIYNLQGQLMQSLQTSNSRTEINLSHLDNGIYLIKASNGTESFTQRVVKM